jgi:hypothetical protein
MAPERSQRVAWLRSPTVADEAGRASVLGRLEAFVGGWDVETVFPHSQLADADITARTDFEWILDRRFLAQRAEVSHPDAPDGFMVIAVGPDDGYPQHYFDARGVVRTYAMTFDGRVWTLTRAASDFTPLEFAQRFTGTFDEDGRTIRGRWEIGGRGLAARLRAHVPQDRVAAERVRLSLC